MSKKIGVDYKELPDIVQEGVKLTFREFFGFEPKLIEQEIKPVAETDFKERSISGIMPFIQEGIIEGTLSIGFARGPVLKMLEGFYKESIRELDDERVTGGVGEIANVVHGIIKEKLNAHGHSFKMCLPTIVVGPNHSIFSAYENPAMTMIFDTPYGGLFVELIFHSQMAKPTLKKAV